MSQKQPCHRQLLGSYFDHRQVSIESVTAAVRTQRAPETNLEAQVLRIVAQKSDWLTTPDILALRTQLDADVSEQARLQQQVRNVVEAITETVATWDQQEMRL
ncbi:hypothetical protein ACODNH_01555 (plasmid) [Haloarcula sp. NS06]|uniref:hypothetical protein n=1 Tax=Haloarcula sp. NS06 TaxID=3409688 RepID=UPI003DA79909